ncbi:MAG: hypothetical protein IKT62_06005 [Firmicutes bacterium]|nr:hypothetical protein [Bacillota bacterium]
MIYTFLLMICAIGVFIAYRDDIKRVVLYIKEKELFKKRKEAIDYWVMKKRKSKMDKELFSSSIILKNLSLVQGDNAFSADYMYEKLMENSVVLKPVYGQMLTLYRSRNNSEAFKVLPSVVGTKASKNFAIILSKLEKLNPAELAKQMEVFQRSMMGNRVTYAIKRVQRNSLVLTVLATVTVFVLLLNFIVVVVLLDTIDTLNQLFI